MQLDENIVSCPSMNTGQPKMCDPVERGAVALRLEHVDGADCDVTRTPVVEHVPPALGTDCRIATGRDGDAHLAVGDEHLRGVAGHHGRATGPARRKRRVAVALQAGAAAPVGEVDVVRIGDEPRRLPRRVLTAARHLAANGLSLERGVAVDEAGLHPRVLRVQRVDDRVAEQPEVVPVGQLHAHADVA